MIKKLLLLIGVCFLFTPTPTLANACLDSGQSANKVCQKDYAYDQLVMFFKDANNTEQKVHAKRVREKSTGELVHVDYDFIASCKSNCGNLDAVITDIFWGFRNAHVEDRIYEKVVYQCDPTMEVCCDKNGCTEIYDSNTASKDSRSLKKVDNDNQSMQRSGRRMIDKNLERADRASAIADRALRRGANGQDVKMDMQALNVQPMKFGITNTLSGGTIICAFNNNGICEQLNGYATVSDRMVDISLDHNNGREFTRDLNNFLNDSYNINRMYCSSSFKCEHTGQCSLTLTCSQH